ncbi:CaiB/BaiF CoA transferase family protein [Immundisolibacter sp.]|uniref:CaiB/BaiF CoA transferase family protein n=1 Tax=Immundisolibacter sp. TaxID=1934948 RepID=UPI003569C4E2
MFAPLAGVRVLELAPFLPGPFAGAQLLALGAEVVKLEPPGGDPGRHLPDGLFAMNNRGKKSLCLDLKAPGATQLVQRLVAGFDVVLEGFRPGVAKRLSVDYDSLRQARPDIIYCSLSGFGQDGTRAQLPGHDLTYLAAGGALARAGHWQGPPRRLGVPVADTAGGLFAALAVVSALLRRQTGGAGAYLDASLTDAALSLAACRGLAAPESRQHLHPANDLFHCRDGGVIAVGLLEDHFFEAFVAALGAAGTALRHPDFANMASRQRNGDALHSLLDRLMATRDVAEWEALAAAHKLPLAKVLNVSEALAVQDPGVPAPAFPVRVDHQRLSAPLQSAPVLGADSAQILSGLGLDQSTLMALHQAGVVPST